MRALPPIPVTPALLTSTSCAEPSAGEAVWASGTTYAVGDRVISTTTHRVYESLKASNAGKDPTLAANASWWLNIGPTNRWAMFDLLRNTGTTTASPLTVSITPGQRVDSIGVVGMVADTVSVTVTVAGATVYTASANLLNRPTGGWYDYFFGAFRYRQEFARFDLPPYTNAVVTITLTKANGNVTCGGVVLGSSVYLGRTLHEAESDALNFSKIDRDDFGTATLVPRRSVPRTVQTLRCKKTDVDRILQLRDDLNATPALWSGLDDQDSGYFSALLIVGVYKRFTISMDQPEDALISLELEEV
jgi:hypothetical protein